MVIRGADDPWPTPTAPYGPYPRGLGSRATRLNPGGPTLKGAWAC